MARAPAQRAVRCYLCGCRFEVSLRALSTACPGCNKAIKIEDVVIKSYLPVTDLQTCGRLRVTKRGRIAATRIQCGEGIECEGTIEGAIETEGDVTLGPHASWKGIVLQSRTLRIAPGAKLLGAVKVPWQRPEAKRNVKSAAPNVKSAAPKEEKEKPAAVVTAAKAQRGSVTRKAASTLSRTPPRRPARG